MMTFEIRRAPSGNFTWCLVDQNGAVVARSLSTYRSMNNLNRAIQSVRQSAIGAPVVDMTSPSAMEAV